MLSPSTLGNLVTTGEVVTFYSGSTVLGTGTLNAFGIATFSTSTLPVGTASLTATYVGDANFLTDTSPAFREVVDPTGTGVLDIHGRWEFAITSGDSPAQLSMSGQSTISSYILQSGTALTNIVPFNTDTIICDTDGLNNATVIGSSIDTGGNVSITFSITDAASPTFQYVFTGIGYDWASNDNHRNLSEIVRRMHHGKFGIVRHSGWHLQCYLFPRYIRDLRPVISMSDARDRTD